MFQLARKLFGSKAKRRKPFKFSRLAVEVLEDRCVPAVFTVNNLNDLNPAMPLPNSLRDVINRLNLSNDPTNTINFQAGLTGQITLSAPLTISKPVLINGGTGQAPVIVIDGAAGTILNVSAGLNVALDNIALTRAGAGGAISSAGNGTLTLNRDIFTSNGSTSGGAVNVTGQNNVVNATACIFVGNTASVQGGAVSVSGTQSVVNVVNSRFVRNNSPLGGAIAVNGSQSSLYVGHSEFIGNKALNPLGLAGLGNGGAIFAEVPVTLSDSDQFAVNEADVSGGAVFVLGTSLLTINQSCAFSRNTAASFGGAVFATSADVGYSSFILNSAATGGAISTTADITGSLVVNDTLFSSNTATGAGGAISASTSTFNIANCAFNNNVAGTNGGAIEYVPFSLTPPNIPVIWAITNDSLIGNTAGINGGALYVTLPSLGGIDLDQGTIDGSFFGSNAANAAGIGADLGAGGGGIYLEQRTVATQSQSTTIANSTFYDNSAVSDGGAIQIRATNDEGSNSVEMVSLTVAANYAGGNGGGIYSDAIPQVDNSIIANNIALGSANDVFGDVNSQGYNVVGEVDGSSGWQSSGPEIDQTGTSAAPLDAGLDPAGPPYNPGAVGVSATEVITLGNGSVAFRKGNPNLAGTTDQQRMIRQTGQVSVGAYDPDAINNAPVVGLGTSDNAPIVGDAVTLTATVVPNSGQTATPTGFVEFVDGSKDLGSAVVNSTGTARLTYTSLTAGDQQITAVYDGDEFYQSSTSGELDEVVGQAVPVINWNSPSNIIYGTPLNSTQLDATTTVPGTFSYTLANGTLASGAVLGVGNNQTLQVTFTPTDSTDYATVTDSVSINVVSASSTTTLAAPAQGSNALTFNGVNQYVNVPQNSAFQPAGAISIGAWVKVASVVNSNDAFVLLPGSYELDCVSGNYFSETVIFSNVTAVVLYAPIPSLNQWHYVSMTDNGSTVSLYVDGTLESSAPATGSAINYSGSSNLHLSDPTNPINATMGDVRIYNRGLSASEEATIAANGPQSFSDGITSGLVGARDREISSSLAA